MLELLRERRVLPEYVDFPAFKQEQDRLFVSVLERQEELMHLPDGRTLRRAGSPHPFGGLLFLFEDVTDRLALERSYNTLIEVQGETINNLHEGVAVFADIEDGDGDSDWVAGATLSAGARVRLVPAEFKEVC